MSRLADLVAEETKAYYALVSARRGDLRTRVSPKAVRQAQKRWEDAIEALERWKHGEDAEADTPGPEA